MATNADGLTFWDHLEALRMSLLRMLAVIAVVAVVAFAFKEMLFDIVLAPRDGSFVTYRMMGAGDFRLHLMNTGLTEQFMIHVRTAAYAGLLVASPYVLYELFRFVSPALYADERHGAMWIVGAAYIMFIVGTLINYFLVFPLTVRFLGTYQVSADVDNMLTLQSYVDTLLSMSLVMGIVFELPVVCWTMDRLGLLDRETMKQFRRHAVVAVMVVAAVITPTTDAFTLLVVAVPIYLLYELSVLTVRPASKKRIEVGN